MPGAEARPFTRWLTLAMFAAVAALVATYEALSRRARTKGLNQRMAQYGRLRRFVTRDVGGLALTSLVAGVATGLYAAYHFHRVAPLGLVANLGAMPLVSIIVMPLALISVLAMPFGLEYYPLTAMAWGIEGVVAVAGWVANAGPAGNTGHLPVFALGLGTAGLLSLCLLRTRLRLIGLPLIMLAALVVTQRSHPDVLILENGRQIGVRMNDGRMALMRPRAEKFAVGIWKRAFAPAHVDGGAAGDGERTGSVFRCDRWGCVGVFKGSRIVHASSAASLGEDCLLAHILVLG